MFIDGIGGIVNTASTVASATGIPARSVTVTSIALSPLLGGSGLLVKTMLKPSLLTVPPAVPDGAAPSLPCGAWLAAGSCERVQPYASTAATTNAAAHAPKGKPGF